MSYRDDWARRLKTMQKKYQIYEIEKIPFGPLPCINLCNDAVDTHAYFIKWEKHISSKIVLCNHCLDFVSSLLTIKLISCQLDPVSDLLAMLSISGKPSTTSSPGVQRTGKEFQTDIHTL